MKTRIDFHSNVSNQLDYACRLVRKALAAHYKLVVLHQDKEQLVRFDQLLWEFSVTDFLPHVALNQGSHPLAQHTSVWLTLPADEEISEYPPSTAIQGFKILINLSDKVPKNFAQFERLIEIVPQVNEVKQVAPSAEVQAGRERFRFYQQQGYKLNHINAA